MKNKTAQLIIENIISLSLSSFIMLFMGYVWFKRFVPRLPKDMFYPPYFIQGFIYLCLFLVNVIILCFLVRSYIKNLRKITVLHLFIYDLNTLYEKTYYKILALITKIDILSYPIAYMTSYFIRVSPKYYRCISFIIPCIFMIAFIMDVYCNIFRYSYIIVYLVFVNLILRFILYLSLVFNQELRDDINRSIVIINTSKLQQDPPMILNEDDYALTKNNIQFKNVSQALEIRELIDLETNRLLKIKDALDKPIVFQLFLRLFYVILWFYIFIYYPFPVMKTTLIIIYKILTKYVY